MFLGNKKCRIYAACGVSQTPNEYLIWEGKRFMNIVYISHLTNIKAQGPNNSVPAQISAQSKIDNVFWWNLTDAIQEHWIQTGLFHGIEEFPVKDFINLPEPFNKPDLVVFESFYYMDDVKMARLCRKRKVPYVIVPRSALTRSGQKKKWYKKIIANLLFFRPMTKGANAIQYLTVQEKEESGKKWNTRFFVIPNGICMPDTLKKYEDNHSLHGISIGRIDPYQKGLDILIEACEQLKEELIDNGFSVSLHGPERHGCRAAIKKEIQEKHLDDILKIEEGVFDDEKRKAILESDFFVMTSRFEGHPMALLEALSYGLPCLVSRGSNMKNEIDKYDAGWTCETTVESIKEGILQLISDRNQFSNKGVNASKLAREYNWNAIATKSHEYYKRCIEKKWL